MISNPTVNANADHKSPPVIVKNPKKNAMLKIILTVNLASFEVSPKSKEFLIEFMKSLMIPILSAPGVFYPSISNPDASILTKVLDLLTSASVLWSLMY